jgi:hypothetical protein
VVVVVVAMVVIVVVVAVVVVAVVEVVVPEVVVPEVVVPEVVVTVVVVAVVGVLSRVDVEAAGEASVTPVVLASTGPGATASHGSVPGSSTRDETVEDVLNAGDSCGSVPVGTTHPSQSSAGASEVTIGRRAANAIATSSKPVRVMGPPAPIPIQYRRRDQRLDA